MQENISSDQSSLEQDSKEQPFNHLNEPKKNPLIQRLKQQFSIRKQYVFALLGTVAFVFVGYFVTTADLFMSSPPPPPNLPKAYVSPTPYPTASPRPPTKHWVLKKTANGQTTTVAALCSEEYCAPFEFWEDSLIYKPIYQDELTDYDPMELRIHNLVTGEDKAVVDGAYFQSVGSGRPPYELNHFYIIDNTLFISVGGYLAGGGIYWVDLPATKPVAQLYDGSNPRIEQWKGRYWIIGGEGDSCWSFSNYSVIDIQNKKVGPKISIDSKCYKGEDKVSLDKRDRMIVVGYDRGEDPFSGEEKITYVIAIPIDNPTVKEGVISAQDMPPKIKKVSYDDAGDKLLLYGESNYTYDFASKNLNKVESLPEYKAESLPYTDPTDEEELAKLNNAKLPDGYQFVFE